MRTGREFKETTYPDDSLEFYNYSEEFRIVVPCDSLRQKCRLGVFYNTGISVPNGNDGGS